MFEFLFDSLREALMLLGGAFIGWNLPQPQWAKDVQTWVSAKYNDLKAKAKARFSK